MAKVVRTLRKVFNRNVRAYIYSVAVASISFAVAVGWLQPEVLPVLLPLALALLNLTPAEVEQAALEQV